MIFVFWRQHKWWPITKSHQAANRYLSCFIFLLGLSYHFFMRICVSYRISWIRIIDLIIILFSISIYLYVFTLSTSILELLRAPEFYYFPNFLEPPENVNTKIKTKNNPNWTLSKFYWVRLCPNLPQNEINFPKKHKKMKFSEKKIQNSIF